MAGEKLDTALGVGASYGAASAVKGTWEFGVTYQQVEKDALFGQLHDSDFGDGNTDTNGYVIRGGYTIARNWTLNGALFLNNLLQRRSAVGDRVQRGDSRPVRHHGHQRRH